MDTTPEDVVRELFTALERRQWRVAAQLIAPQSLATIRDRHLGMLAAIEMHKAAGAATGGGSMVAIQQPTGDFLERFGSVKVRVFPGSPTIGELASLPPEDFYVRWQSACHRATLPLRAYAVLWRLFHRKPEMDRPVVLGGVTEGDDLAHVVYRVPGYVDPWRAEVISLKQIQSFWRIQVDDFMGWPDPLRMNDHLLMGRAMLGSVVRSKLAAIFRLKRRNAQKDS